jgi:hypothetical protein
MQLLEENRAVLPARHRYGLFWGLHDGYPLTRRSPTAAITRTQAEKARRFEIQPNCGRDAICGTATRIAMANLNFANHWPAHTALI